MGCDSHLPSVSGVSPNEILDIEKSNKEIKNVTSVTSIDNFPNVHGNTCLLPAVSNIADVISSEQGKRPFYDDEVYLSACKRPKQVDQNSHFESCIETQLRTSMPLASGLLVANDVRKNEVASQVDLANTATCRSLSASHPKTSLESPIHQPSLYTYFENYHRASGICQADQFFSPAFDCLPRKLVAIGSDHQADVSKWRPHSLTGPGESSHSSPLVPSNGCNLTNEVNIKKWTGCCIIPIPDISLPPSDVRVVLPKTDCGCQDEGSVKCVRQHIKEEREELGKILGEKFDQLGLCDMGEVVARKWTVEEEHLFQAVVLSNPASLGKNFWDVLPYFFPSRSSKELVSYYFNVFMLRKRAQQNRLDPLNVDSDNDEWQENDDDDDDDDDDAFAVEEEDEEDSVLESLADECAIVCNKADNENVEVILEGADDGDGCAIDEEGCLYGVSEGYSIHLPPAVDMHKKNLQNSMVEQDGQDDSCTSYEAQHGADSCGGHADIVDVQYGLIEACDDLSREYKNDGSSGALDQDNFDSHS